MPRQSSKKETFQFETAIGELEKLVETMESGDLSLEDSLKAFERGINLTRQCQQALTEAEQKVQILLEKDGKHELTDLQLDASTGEADNSSKES